MERCSRCGNPLDHDHPEIGICGDCEDADIMGFAREPIHQPKCTDCGMDLIGIAYWIIDLNTKLCMVCYTRRMT